MFSIQTVVDPAKPQSEDVVGSSRRAAWVLDGTSGRDGTQYSDPDEYESDGVWYARTFSEHLEFYADDESRRLREIVQDGIRSVSENYFDLRDDADSRDDLDMIEPPAASLCLVRWRMDSLEYYVLGDCSIVVETLDDREDIYLTDVGQRPFDEQLKNIMYIDGDSSNLRDVFIKQQYRKRNTKVAYYVASLTPDAAYNGVQGRIPLDNVASLLLFSDGVEHLVDTYNAYDTWAHVRETIRDQSLDAVIDDLRHYEYDVDPDCEQYPRIKQADDASVVFLDRDEEDDDTFV